MKILILEGIATSGKSTIVDAIKKYLSGVNIRVAGETETHIPIMKQTDKLHVRFFEDLINQLFAEKPELIIFDRLYLTQAFRAGVGLSQYNDIENTLSRHGAFTVFLRVDEHEIAERVAKAAGHRDPSWGEYIKTKGTTMNEIADYYIAQQRNQLKLLDKSTLPFLICDTTHHNYAEIAQKILKELHLK